MGVAKFSIFGCCLIFTGRNEVVAKVIFLHLSVILFTGGSASVHAGMPPPCQGDPPEGGTPTPCQGDPPAKKTPRRETPQKEAPLPRRPPAKETPPPLPKRRPPLPSRHPPPEGGTPLPRRPPNIWSMSSQYVSYWNAFLFPIFFLPCFTPASLCPAYHFYTNAN